MKPEKNGQPTPIFTEDLNFNDVFSDEYRAPIYESALLPYADEDVLVGRLTSGSRLFRKYPEAEQIVDEALMADDEGSILAAGELLAETLQAGRPANEKPVGTLLTFLTAVNHVVDSKNMLSGNEASNYRLNVLTWLMTSRFVSSIPAEQVGEYIVSADFLQYQFKRLQHEGLAEDINDTHVLGRLIFFESELTHRYKAMKYAETFPDKDETTYSAEQIAQDTKQISEMFGVIQAEQQYGLKLAYKNHELGGSLIFSPSYMTTNNIEENSTIRNFMTEAHPAAMIVHSKSRSFKSIKPKLTDAGSHVIGYNVDDLNSLALFELGQDGELYADRLCNIPVRDIFVAQGKYEAYRRLQAGIIADYFDMTQPAFVVDRAKREVNGAAAQPVIPGEPMEVFGRLLAPRVRYAREDNRTAIAAEEAEAETAQTDSEAVGLQKLRQIGWHRRKLAEGSHASPDAIALAAKYGVALKPNQTFVRPHTRGNKKVGEVVGHLLVNN